MNIIKLKDIIKPGDEMFNKHLKGKYAYWVHMRYIVPFSFMKHEGYVACEEDINKLLKKQDGTYPKPYGCPYIDVYNGEILPYVDVYATDKANNVMEYRRLNNYVPDSNITLDEIKRFRTWLAEELLKLDQSNTGEQLNDLYNEEVTHMLTYYSKGMYDDVVKYLSMFGSQEISISSINKSTCGCNSNSDLSSLYNQTLSNCDALSVYRKNIYNKMVKEFSDYNFWFNCPTEFILTFKSYIDNIIDCNLKLTKTSYVSEFVDCGCKSSTNIEQENNINILKRLSESLGYMSSGNILGHKNYIVDALKDWSVYLYEMMEW